MKKLNKVIKTRSQNETTKDFKDRMNELLIGINAFYENQDTTWYIVFMYSSPSEISDAIFLEKERKVSCQGL